MSSSLFVYIRQRCGIFSKPAGRSVPEHVKYFETKVVYFYLVVHGNTYFADTLKTYTDFFEALLRSTIPCVMRLICSCIVSNF
jgi:hypothetical protein